MLKKYAALFQILENENFHSEIIQKHKNELVGAQNSAFQSLKKLSRISATFDYRLNLLVGIFLNIFFLWDILQCIRLEVWKERYGQKLENWFKSLTEIDELCSFSGFAFAHPESVFPEFSSDEFRYI